MTAVGGLLLALETSPAASPSRLAAAATAPLRSTTDRTLDPTSIFDTRAPAEKGRWTSIIINHSGSPIGSSQTIARQHEARGLKGLGHHFVIGNGSGAPDGQITIGYRWLDQLPGAHTAGPEGDYYNRNAIGICLVGDGERRPFTEAQLRSLVELVTALQERLGIPDDQVILHRSVSSSTASPGRLFPEAAFRESLALR